MTPSGFIFSYPERVLPLVPRVNFSQICQNLLSSLTVTQMYKTVLRNLQQLLPSGPIRDQLLMDMTFRVLCRHLQRDESDDLPKNTNPSKVTTPSLYTQKHAGILISKYH